MSNKVWVTWLAANSKEWKTGSVRGLDDNADIDDLCQLFVAQKKRPDGFEDLEVFETKNDREPLKLHKSLKEFFVNLNAKDNPGPGQVPRMALVVLDKYGTNLLLIDDIIRENDKRRDSVEQEIEPGIPTVKERDRPLLGEYLKFVNREKSINVLIQHAAEQFALYLKDGGIEPHRVQWAACSGGPGLGKTTFCRKAFTSAIDDLKDKGNILWKDVATKDARR